MVVVRDAVCTMVGTSRRVGVDAEGDAGVEGEVAVIAEAIIGGCRTLGGLGGEDVGRRLAHLGGGTRRRTGGDAFLTLTFFFHSFHVFFFSYAVIYAYMFIPDILLFYICFTVTRNTSMLR